MKSSVEELLSALLSNTGDEKDIKSPIDEKSDIRPSNEQSMKIQRKIDILKGFEPAVSDKNKEFINFFIKALTIAKLISDMDTKE